MEAPDTVRVLLTVQYDGSAFHGWQVQPDQRTIQGALEEATSRLADRPCTVLGSGRTDTGVHATGQVAAVDVPSRWSAEALRRALNATLPADVWIERAALVRPDFHPRFDAVARTYTYRVGTSPLAASPFQRPWCWALEEDPDRDVLATCASRLVGSHSFESFAKAGQPERGDRCAIAAAAWSDWELGPLFTITADRYLHHMVRYLVGTMIDMGRGRRPISDLGHLLDRHPDVTTSPPAPACGLFLTRVEYPETVLAAAASADPTSRNQSKA